MWLAFVSTEKKTGRLKTGRMIFPKLKPIKATSEVIYERRLEAYTRFVAENFGDDDWYNFSAEVCRAVGEWMTTAGKGDSLTLPQSDDVDRPIVFYLSESAPTEYRVERATVTQFKLLTDEDDADGEDEDASDEEEEDDEDEEDHVDPVLRRRNKHGRH